MIANLKKYWYVGWILSGLLLAFSFVMTLSTIGLSILLWVV